MSRACLAVLLRRVLAALTVLAAFAFQARMGGMVDLFTSSGAMSTPMTGHRAAPAVHPASTLVKSAATAPDPVAHQHTQVQDHHHQGNPEKHKHTAHCPFCVTGAFTLEAGVLPMLTAPPQRMRQTGAFSPTYLPALPRHADARAPPVRL